MDFSIPAKQMVYLPLSRLVPLFIQQRYDTNPAVRSTSSQKIYLLCLSGVEGLLSGAQKPLNDPVTNLQLNSVHPCRGPLRRSAGHPFGCSLPSHWSEGRSPEDQWLRHHKRSRPRKGVAEQPSPLPATRNGSWSERRSAHRSSPLLRLDLWIGNWDP